MGSIVESYFESADYLPITPRRRSMLLDLFANTNVNPDMKKTAMEETTMVYPTLAYNLLKMINSEMFKLNNKISILKQAVSIPSLDQLRALIERTPVYPEAAEKVLPLSVMGRQAAARANAAYLMTGMTADFSTLEREKLLCGALLRDIGRIFLVMNNPPAYEQILNKSRDVIGLVLAAEKEQFGVNHLDVSREAVERLGIGDPAFLQLVTMHEKVPKGPVALVVYADLMTRQFGYGDGYVPVDAEVLKLKMTVEETLSKSIGETIHHVLSQLDATLRRRQAYYHGLTTATAES